MKPTIVSRPLGDDPPTAKLYYGQDVRKTLRELPEASVHMVATSPPYWGLRDYGGEVPIWGGDLACGHEWGEVGPAHHPGQVEQSKWKGAEAAGKGQTAGSGQFCQHCSAWQGALGLEPTPAMFVEHIVEVFNEIKRVLRPDGVAFVNFGDSYAQARGHGHWESRKGKGDESGQKVVQRWAEMGAEDVGLKPKDLVGIPWRVAFGLQDAGWYLRSDIIWHKRNPMPESVRDRPTKAHEYIFMLAHPDSSGRYFYDADAVREPCSKESVKNLLGRAVLFNKTDHGGSRPDMNNKPRTAYVRPDFTRNKRTVWTVNPKPYPGAHFACWPEKLVEPMVLAGTSQHGCCSKCLAPWTRGTLSVEDVVEKQGVSTGGYPARQDGGVRTTDLSGKGGNVLATKRIAGGWEPTCECDAEVQPCTVLDPFSGSATTGAVAMKHGRHYVGTDLQPDYLPLAQARLSGRKAPKPVAEQIDTGGILDLFGGG